MSNKARRPITNAGKKSIKNLDEPNKNTARELSEDDEIIWTSVTKGVEPLKNRPTPDKDMITPKPRVKVERREGRNQDAMVFISEKPKAQTTLTRKQQRRIHKGHVEIDRVIDLHGLSQVDAKRRLNRDIPDARSKGEYCLLVITGKGGVKYAQTHPIPVAHRKYEEFSPSGGVLQQAVPDWLRGPELSPHVASFEGAHQSHGGRGALYVILRKPNFKGSRP